MLVLAHLSDPHFAGRGERAARTRAALAHVAAMDPPVDLLLVTGDIADHGLAEEYAEADAVFANWSGPAPILWCPGNHDVRAAYAAWQGAPVDRPVNRSHRIPGLLVVLLDSMVPADAGRRIDHGYLAPETLTWLDAELAGLGPDELAVVCLHHPPPLLHQRVMDPIRLRNADDLEEVLTRHDRVAAVLVGHAHTACATTYAGRPLLVGGGLASTVPLDAEDLPYITDSLPACFAVHLLEPTGRIVTHWRALPL